MKKVSLTSLGCPRNLVDSEVMAGILKNEGFEFTGLEDDPDICIINTCSFTQEAREEAIEAILEAAALKKEGRIKHLVVCGCLPQLYKEELLKELPEIDVMLGTTDFYKINSYIRSLGGKGGESAVSKNLEYLYDEHSPRSMLTPPHYAYVKVSEGCDNLCSYCVIPEIRGRLRSRAIESVLEEMKKISSGGRLREINIVGQDTTVYGLDLYKRPAIAELLHHAAALGTSVRWLRLLYTHPAHFTDELVAAIRDEDKICKYVDLPIQHVSDPILKAMNRKTTRRDIEALIEKLRKNIPGVAIRTSIIVGFPGETDKDFKELLEFVEKTRFERLGAFVYSREERTPAHHMEGHLPDEVKKARFDELMALQQRIAADNNRKVLGQTIEVLIDEKLEGEDNKYIGRTQYDAPDVDQGVYVTGNALRVGEFCEVRINDTLEYDLVGDAV